MMTMLMLMEGMHCINNDYAGEVDDDDDDNVGDEGNDIQPHCFVPKL